jgi:hypothetical protein
MTLVKKAVRPPFISVGTAQPHGGSQDGMIDQERLATVEGGCLSLDLPGCRLATG